MPRAHRPGITAAICPLESQPSLGRRGSPSHGPGSQFPTRGRLAARSAGRALPRPGAPLPAREARAPPLAAGGPSSRAMVRGPWGPPASPRGRARGRDAREARAGRVVLAGGRGRPAAPWPGPQDARLLPGGGRSPLRRAGWGRDGAGLLLEAGLARVLYYLTLLYTLFRGKMPGPRTATASPHRFHRAAGRQRCRCGA